MSHHANHRPRHPAPRLNGGHHPWSVDDVVLAWNGKHILIASEQMPPHDKAELERLLNTYRVMPKEEE